MWWPLTFLLPNCSSPPQGEKVAIGTLVLEVFLYNMLGLRKAF